MQIKHSRIQRVLSRFRNWVKDQIVADVPEDLAICEFDCPQSQCCSSNWITCQLRITKGAGELRPAIRSADALVRLQASNCRGLGDAA